MTRGWKRTALLAVVAALVAGCTTEQTPEPDPDPPPPAEEEPAVNSSGLAVGVVIPGPDSMEPSVRVAIRRDVEELARWTDDDVRDVRAAPADSAVFVGDLAEVLADRGTGLVCVLGDDATPVIDRLAPRYSAVTFCSVQPVPLEEAGDDDDAADAAPGTVHILMEELGYLVGLAARSAAGSAPVGAVFGGDGVHDARWRAGVEAGAGTVVELTGDERSMAEQTEVMVDIGVGAVVIDGGVGAGDAVHVAAEAGIGVLTPHPVWEDALRSSGAVATWWMAWDVVLRAPILALTDEEFVAGQPLGVGAEIFQITSGDLASPQLTASLETAIEQLASGTLDPLEPAEQRGVPSQPDPIEGPADDPDPTDPEPTEDEPTDPEPTEDEPTADEPTADEQ